MAITPGEVLEFWFSEPVCNHWFSATPELDQQIAARFQYLWGLASEGRLDHWMTTPEGCLALTIILDQFPLNMFRGQARSFASEAQARTVAGFAIKRGFDQQLDDSQKVFLYMPYMHSEALQDQDLSVQLFEAAGLKESLAFARHHRELIRTYGRFPHRNAILGRQSRPDELDYLASDAAFTG